MKILKNNSIFFRKIAVYGTVLGYWYNLPVISTGIFGGYNEFRLYDFTFLLLLYLMVYKKDYLIIFRYLRSNIALNSLFKFSKWSSIMIIPTFLFSIWFGKIVFIGMSVIFLYHLWGFLLLAAYINVFFRGVEFVKITRWFLLLSTIHLFIYYAQIGGGIGHLWPAVYQQSYGEQAFSGTLGPNRITPGMMTLLGFVMGIYVILKNHRLKGMRLIAIINIAFSLPVLLMIGSRTTFFTLLLFVLFYILLYSRKYTIVLLLFIPAVLIAFQFLGEKQKERIAYNIEYNQKKLLEGSELSEMDLATGYSNLGSGRYQILENYIPYLFENFYIIPFGSGFNNRMYAATQTSAASAHNIYFSLINEVGLVGLFLYLSWLWGYIRIARFRIKMKGQSAIYGLVIALGLAMLISLFSGEHLYIYRPCFALMGTYIFINNAILNDHQGKKRIIKPLLLNPKKNENE